MYLYEGFLTIFLVLSVIQVKAKIAASQPSQMPHTVSYDSGSEVEDDEPLSQPSSSQPSVSQPSVSHTRSDSPVASTSMSTLSHKKKGEPKEAVKEVQVLLKQLAEQQETTDKLQAKVRTLLQQTEEWTSYRAMWGAWIALMMPCFHDQVVQAFMKDSFSLVINYVSQSNAVQTREVQMSHQAAQPPPSGQVSHQQQQQQPQQYQQHFAPQPSSSQPVHQFSSSRSTTPSPSQQVSRGGGSSETVTWATPGPSSHQRITPRQLSNSANLSNISGMSFLQDLSFSGLQTAEPFLVKWSNFRAKNLVTISDFCNTVILWSFRCKMVFDFISNCIFVIF